MPSRLVILLISCICAACAAVGGPAGVARAHRGGVVRIAVEDARETAFAKTAALCGRAAIEVSSSRPEDETGCRRLRVARRAAFPDGRPITPGDVIAAWEAGLGKGDTAHRRLLAPVVGAAQVSAGRTVHATGLVERDGALLVCAATAIPDWEQRLAHPDLWALPVDPVSGLARGPGAFRQAADGDALVRVGERGRLVRRLEFVGAAGRSAATLLAVGEADVAVLYGDEASSLPVGRLSVERIPAWDRIYALWLNAEARWLNDPAFRRWLASTIDRVAAVEIAAGGHGEPAERLGSSGDAALTEAVAGAVTRPFGRSSAPGFEVAFDRTDRIAASLAARVKAELEPRGVSVDLAGRNGPAHLAPPVDRALEAVLLRHAPAVGDPVLALQETLWPLRSQAPDVWSRLERAARVEDPSRRADAARAVERRLLEDARLVPLVRVHARLATDRDLRRVEAGSRGVLRFEDARWKP